MLETSDMSPMLKLSHLYILYALFNAYIVRPVDATTCYRPNGVVGSSDIQPRQSSSGHSPCCNLGKSSPDLCLAGGLCYRQDGSDGNFLICAVGCTDSSGADAACQQYCPFGDGVVMYSLNACWDGQWCCNNLTTQESCCDPHTGKGVFTLKNILSLDPAPSATATHTVTQALGAGATATVTKTITPSACSGTQVENGTCSKNTAVIAGAAAGAGVGGFLLATSLACCFFARFYIRGQRQQKNTEFTNQHTDVIPHANVMVGPRRYEIGTKQESEGLVKVQPQEKTMSRHTAYEIDGTTKPIELSDGTVGRGR